jgi:hypothetical protein
LNAIKLMNKICGNIRFFILLGKARLNKPNNVM